MTAYLLPQGKQQYFTAAGVPLVGGKVFTYDTGTTTPRTTWSDAAQTAPNTNPVILDARGEATIFWQGAYRVVLQDSLGNAIYTVDGVAVDSDQLRSDLANTVSTSLGAGLVGFSPTLAYASTTVGGFLYNIYKRTAAEIAAGVTPTAYYYPEGHAWRYGCNPDGVTNTTTQLNNWLACGSKTLYLPAGTYICTNLTQKSRSNIRGDGPRVSVLRHIASATGVLLTLQTGIPPSGGVNDITEGSFTWSDFGIQPRALAGCYGVSAAAGLFSMLRSDNFRIQNQQSETLGAPPYAVVADTRGFSLDGAAGAAIFMANHRNIEIRSCESAVYGRNIVNEWFVHGWFLDCQYGFNVNTISTWTSAVTHESNVANARAWLLSGACSNINAPQERWEFPQAGCYGVEFSGAVTGNNCNFNWPNVLITGDGSAWPGRKYTGTLPVGFIFRVMLSGMPYEIGAAMTEFNFGQSLKVGGASRGDGKVTIGRDAGGGDSVLYYDLATGHTYLTAANNLRVGGDGSVNFKFSVNSTGCGFFGINPIAQPTTGVAAATFVANAGTAVNDASTFDGYTLKQIAKALRNLALLA